MKQNQDTITNPPSKTPIAGTERYTLSLHTKVTGTENPMESILTYDVVITYTEDLFAWKKTNFKINNQKALHKVNELYQKATDPLHALEFQCSPKGKINKLYNHENLIKSWEQTKDTIQKEFIGQPITQFIEQLDQKYYNIKTLEEQLSNDPLIESFYRAFINDGLLYYTKSNTIIKSAGVLKNTKLPFKAEKTLTTLGDHLQLKTHASLQKKETETTLLENYFINKVDDFNIDALAITIEEDTLLNNKTTWIEQTKSIQTMTIGSYKKEIILTLQRA